MQTRRSTTFSSLRYILYTLLTLRIYCSTPPEVYGQVDDVTDPCDERIKQTRSEMETLHAQELRSVSDDLGWCRATFMASETRESMLQQQISDLERKTSSSQEVSVLKTTVSILQEQLGTTTSAHENLSNELVSLREQLESARSSNYSLQQNEIDQVQQSHNRELAVERETAASDKAGMQQAFADEVATAREEARAELQRTVEQHASDTATIKQAIKDLEAQLQAATLANEDLLVAKRALETSVVEAKGEATAGASLCLKQYSELSTAHDQLIKEAKDREDIVATVNAELFIVRRELHTANNKLREPALKRRMMIKWAREKLEPVVKLWDHVWGWMQPYVEPLWESVHAATTSLRDMFKERYPVWKQRVLALLEPLKVNALELMLQLQGTTKQQTNQKVCASTKSRWEKVKEQSLAWQQNTASSLEQVKAYGLELHLQFRAVTKPYLDQIWKTTEEPRLILTEWYRDLLEPHALRLKAWHASVSNKAADVLYTATDSCIVALGHDNLVARQLQVVHDHRIEAVYYVQGVAILLLFGLLLGVKSSLSAGRQANAIK